MNFTNSLTVAVAVGLGVVSAPALAAESQSGVPHVCAVPAELLHAAYPLPRVASRLRAGEALKIVAIGSSSTAGTGASSVRATYPSRLEADLREMFPRVPVTVVNRGVPGEDAASMLVRFKRDAIDPKPDLIVWQTGTNSALGGGNVESYAAAVTRGIRMARKEGIDILLMGPQYAPRFESVANRMTFINHLHTIAEQERVPMFPRYEVMKYWIKSGQFTNKAMINPDGLHLTDASYDCLGWLVARMIGQPEIATARAAR